MIKLFWCPQTRASRALWMLEETGVDYDRITTDIRNPASIDDEDFRRASPMGKVPAIMDGVVSVAESAAICLYLADRYAMGRLAPPLDHPDRGRYLYWVLFTPSILEPAAVENMRGAEANRLSHSWGDYDSMLTTLRDGLQGGPWLLGEQFTAADVMVGSTVHFLRNLNLLPDEPVFNDYAQRCQDRPGYAHALSLEPS